MDTIEQGDGISVYIISPLDKEGEPLDLFFAVTEKGLLLHSEKMDANIPDEVVQDYFGKLLFGMESTDGRYNDFVKHPENYKIRMKVVTDMKPEDARKIDELYHMNAEARRKRLREDLSWAE